MRNQIFSVLFGLTATVLVSSPLRVQAETKLYEFGSGYESLRFDAAGIEALKSIGLSLNSVESTAVPAAGYDYAFNYVPSPTGNDFVFSYDDVTKEFTPIRGTVDFSGSTFFDVDTNKLNLTSPLELGNLFAEPAANLNVVDTITTKLPIFNLVPTAPARVDLEKGTTTLNFAALIAPEFSDYLIAAGASKSIAGVKLGDIQGDRNITPIPEPASALAILVAASTALAVGKRRLT